MGDLLVLAPGAAAFGTHAEGVEAARELRQHPLPRRQAARPVVPGPRTPHHPAGYSGRVSAGSGDERAGTAGTLPPIHESWLPREHSLYRPRHGTQRSALVCAAVFFTLPLVALLVFGPSETTENRARAQFPAPADGWGFFTGMSAWADDNIAFKQNAIDVSNFLSRQVLGERPRLGRGDTPPVGPVAPPPPPPKTTSAPPTTTRQNPDNRTSDGYSTVIDGRDGWMYLGYDVLGKCEPSQTLKQIMGNVRTLRTAAEQSGRRFVLVIAPDKTTMEPYYLPDDYTGKECAAAAAERFWSAIAAEPGAVDLRGPLRAEAQRLGRPLYFPSDTHWTFEGGLVMARAIAGGVQPGVDATWQAVPGPEWTSEADLPRLVGSTAENRTTRPGLAPDGAGDRTNWINGDFRTTLTLQRYPGVGVVTGKTAMLADSFTRFATGYLAAGFEDITITHVEQINTDHQLVADRLASADTIVVEVVERHFASGVSPVTNPAFVKTAAKTLKARPRG